MFKLNCFYPLFLSSLIFGMASFGVLAQPAPSAEQMIQQLQTPKTRSLTRSFGVVDRSQEPSAAAPAAAVNRVTAPNSPAASSVSTLQAPPQASAAASERSSLSLNIQFEFDSAKISAASQQALKNLATALAARSLLESKFAIEGHTDAQGRADYNKRLSAQRADAVKQFLIAQGVAGSRLNAVGKGSEELANAQDPRAAENRRVKIINLD
jgi:outer membrane protein OmpA-like peptidoglycan-associated protein